MNKIKLLAATLSVVSTLSSAQASEMPELLQLSEQQDQGVEKDYWPSHSSPAIFSGDYEYNFTRLMTRSNGRVSDAHMPWSDTWWPNNRGGIATRWQVSEAYPSIRLGSPAQNRARILAMRPDQVRLLSPAEKFDIASNNYNFPLTREVLERTNPGAPDWFGICNGWTSAALAHREPAPVEVTNRDGVRISFGSSDVKGVLAYFYAWTARGHTNQIGKKCTPTRAFGLGGGDCEDVHPAAFHVVIVNQIGFLDQPFGADVDGTAADDPEFERTGRRKTPLQYQHEVWNQPVFAYRTRILGEQECTANRCRDVARGTVRRVRVETLMSYADDDHPVWQASLGTHEFFQETRRYEYWLEIDFRGNVVGGSWITAERPDYLYTARSVPFTGAYQALNTIYRPAPARPYCLPRPIAENTEPGHLVYPTTPLCQ